MPEDKVVHIELPGEEKKKESPPPINPNQSYYPASSYPPKESKKLWILGIVFVSLIFILGFIAIMTFYNKDFSNFISIDNKAPDVPVTINNTDNNNNTFINNVTIVLDGEIARMIANQTKCEVQKLLNITNLTC